MMKYNKYPIWCFLCICLFILASCVDDDKPDPITERQITFEMVIVDGSGQTRMTDTQEDALNTVDVLGFKKTGGLCAFAATANHVSGSTYKVILTDDYSEVMFFAFLINYPTAGVPTLSSLVGKTYTNILNTLIIPEAKMPTTSIPMFGVSKGVVINTNNLISSIPDAVRLFRMVAKIDVWNQNDLGAAGADYYHNFEMTEVRLSNRATSGYLGHDTLHIKNYTAGVPDGILYYLNAPYPWQPSTINLSTKDITYALTTATPKKAEKVEASIYTFERPEPVANEDSTYLVIKGLYKGKKGNDNGVPSEYKVYIPELDYSTNPAKPKSGGKECGSILRNHHYTIKIGKVSPAKLEYKLQVVPWTNVKDSTVFEKTYNLDANPQKIILDPIDVGNSYTEKLSFFSDYMWQYGLYHDMACTDTITNRLPDGENPWFKVIIPSGIEGSKNADGYYPVIPKDSKIGIDVYAETKNEADTVRYGYIKFTGYAKHDFKDTIYARMSVVTEIRQWNFKVEPANCYLVDNLFPKKFNIPLLQIKRAMNDDVIPNNWIANPAKLKAQVYWTDRHVFDKIDEGLFDVGSAVVHRVEYTAGATWEEKYITVTPGTGVGNAGIILYEDMNGIDGYQAKTSDVIRWSWHIWNINNIPYESKWMDRNLGAHVTKSGDLSSVGFFYQWGRKDPLPGLGAWDISEATEQTVHTAKVLFAPGASEYIKDSGPTNVQQTVSSPMTAFWDWKDKATYTSWNETTNPCPAGYKVPAATDWPTSDWQGKIGEFFVFTNNGKPNVNELNRYGEYNAACGGYYPAGGHGFDKSGENPEYRDHVVDSSKKGYYWTINPGVAFTFQTGVGTESKSKTFGAPIRCVKNK
ncbi:hypothetical protein [Bacteroides sp. 519]|uniref:hypothetical protein n=1 Tax=Bacteroides sp. 519 TaxID=2302937 RepID=UPI0013CFEF67|nr:hypothetical protein [Bacteroides sp. 519]NDV59527.1 hypothetical protein [Bacteroides sp. 519]